MQKYLSTKVIEFAYNKLSNLEINNSSILHIFFIIKACGFDRTTFKSIDLIKEKGLLPATILSKLFSPQEKSPEKFDFISPFSMKNWNKQSPSEQLKKWVNSRIQNNVIGGATTWRGIITDNIENKTFKFKYDYISKIKNLTLNNNKINITALSIWINRFTKFENQPSPSKLKSSLVKIFNLNDEEISQLFKSNDTSIELSLSKNIHDTKHIRSLIGLPHSQDSTWLDNQLFTSLEEKANIGEELIMESYSNKYDNSEVANILLTKYNQIILSGPPGTSKSFIANSISSSYKKENVVKIQFHPSYSYRNFIGGYIVQGKDVKWEEGILFQLVKQATNNKKENYLIVIEELNRANVGQVFGETIQSLDRDNHTYIKKEEDLVKFKIPTNLKIVATMNTADRSIGVVDFAIKRRFISIYTPPNPDLLDDLCQTNFNFSLGDFLRMINKNLNKLLKNRELSIGHAIFLDINNYDENSKKFKWNSDDFEMIFNFKILPIIEDYTKGNTDQINSILGRSLGNRLVGEEFIKEISNLLNDEN